MLWQPRVSGRDSGLEKIPVPKFKIEVAAEFDLDGLPPAIQGPFVFNVVADDAVHASAVVAPFVLGGCYCTMRRCGPLHFLGADTEHQDPSSFLFPWGARWPNRVRVLSHEEFA